MVSLAFPNGNAICVQQKWRLLVSSDCCSCSMWVFHSLPHVRGLKSCVRQDSVVSPLYGLETIGYILVCSVRYGLPRMVMLWHAANPICPLCMQCWSSSWSKLLCSLLARSFWDGVTGRTDGMNDGRLGQVAFGREQISGVSHFMGQIFNLNVISCGFPHPGSMKVVLCNCWVLKAARFVLEAVFLQDMTLRHLCLSVCYGLPK